MELLMTAPPTRHHRLHPPTASHKAAFTLPALALSVRQPWAWALVQGYKRVENRTWPTAFRGRLLIHASQKEDCAALDFVLAQVAAQTGTPLGEVAATYAEQRHLGGIVGMADLADCVNNLDDPWFVGPWGFVFRTAQPLPFMPCRGALGLFRPTLPPKH